MTQMTLIQQDAMADAADEAAGVLRGLSNPSRLLLLCRLLDGERSVSDLVEELGLGQAYVSQQLSRLRGAGLVACRRDGRNMFYRLADARLIIVIEALHRAFCPPVTPGPG